MRSFKDKNGNEWSIEVDLDFIQRVKRACDINVIDLVMSEAAIGVTDDPEKMGQLLWSICEPAAKDKGILPDKFPKIFNGEAIDAAVSALSLAVADFLSPTRRELAMKIIAKGNEIGRLAVEKMGEKVDALDASKQVTKLLSGRTSSAASAALIRATSRRSAS